VPKCAHKIPSFIKNSAKVHQTPLITDEKFIQECYAKGIDKKCLAKSVIKKSLADGRLFLPLKSAADTDKYWYLLK
jgi:hypothetical protein